MSETGAAHMAGDMEARVAPCGCSALWPFIHAWTGVAPHTLQARSCRDHGRCTPIVQIRDIHATRSMTAPACVQPSTSARDRAARARAGAQVLQAACKHARITAGYEGF